ncbi:MAG TPA: hypothetical protein VG328_08080 [Stellaceae bacterium]|jgi:hypothetical protein|nr:hypothetical protein [Stellaceae bacterium]
MKTLCILSFGIALLLAACGGGEPVLLNGSEQGVIVRYSQANGSSTAANEAAQKFCAQYGRNAVAGTGDASTGDTFVSYTCTKP